MADSIRHRIIAAMALRAADIRSAKGFTTEIGSSVFLAKQPGKSVPCATIRPGRESVSMDGYGRRVIAMDVDVSGFMAFGDTSPEVIAERILADIVEAFTGTEIAYSFTDGEAEIDVGDTLTGDDSGATGYVVAVSVSSGTWAGGDAAGTVTVRRMSGGRFAAETVTISGVDAAVITGATAYDADALSCGGLADSIVYTEGGADDWPEEGQTVAGSSARFQVLYRTETGNPYSQ